MKTAQHKDLKFNSITEFEVWLFNTTHTTIYFFDLGQDLTQMYLASTGEILHTNIQSLLYNGRFVDIDNLQENHPLPLWDDDKSVYNKMRGLMIDEIKTYD